MIKTGFVDIDKLIGGLEGGSLYFVAGRPNMGKQTFVTNIVGNVATKYDKSILMFLLNNKKEYIANKILSGITFTEAEKIREYINQNENNFSSVEMVNQFKIHLEDRVYSIEEIEDIIKKQDNLGLIVIDYLQLIECKIGSITERRDTLDFVLRALKRISKNENIPIIIISALSRNCENRVDKRPILTDLRDTGTIEDIADVILFIYRDYYYYQEPEKKNLAEVIVSKNKFGKTDIAELVFLPEYSKFSNFLKKFE